jgi:hypothetical protein
MWISTAAYVLSSANTANALMSVLGRTISAVDPISSTIDSFGKLPTGWAYGRGGAIPERTLKLAHKWCATLRLQGYDNIEPFPGDEEVLLAVSDGDHYFELIVEADGTVSIAYDYRRRQVFYRSHMTEEETLKTISEMKGRKWSASDFYIRVDTTRRSTNLHGSLLETQALTEHYLLWIGTAFGRQGAPSPTISGTTTENTQLWFGSPQSFGNLIPTKSFPQVTP